MVHNPESMIKGRLAEAIVEEMLREADYEVYRFGYESIVQNLVQSPDKFYKKDGVGQTISSMPDFIAVKNREPHFIEVKYRSDGELEKEEFKKWDEGRVILVFPFYPYFKISRIAEFKASGKLYDLTNDWFVKIPMSILKKYGKIVTKYLGGK